MSESNIAPAIQISTLEPKTVERTYQVITDDFRNEMFDDNIAYFKSHQPDIFSIIKNHHCTDYRLCINPDGSPNIIHMPSKSLVYYSDGNMIFNSMNVKLENIPYAMEISPAYAMTYKPDWYDRNPIATQMYQKLFDLGPIKIMAEDDSRQHFNNTFKPDFIPFLRIYGIGLGYHITRLIQSKDIVATLIYEPEIDLFYTSLYTTPWRLIFKYMQIDPARRFSLIVGSCPDEAIKVEKKFLASNFPFLPVCRWQFKLFQTTAIKHFIELEKEAYCIIGDDLTAGWYEDQRAGLVNCLGNLISGRKLFTGDKVSGFLRVAIVGAGPSLDDSIACLKEHTDDFIIFACGTAITPLLKNGIVPDFHVHQERRSRAEAVMSWAGAKSYKNIIALKLNVVEPEVDELYQDAFIFQKFNDPASALLPEHFPVTKYVNPTVTNSAIAFATQLGANEVYLFGVDYGASSRREKMHAEHYIHAHRVSEKVDKTSKYVLPGNLGDTVISTDKLFVSHNTAEITIASYPQIAWFNVADGALIKGAKPLNIKDIHGKFRQVIDKGNLRREITDCFCDNYSTGAVIENLVQLHGKNITDYFSAIRKFLNVTPINKSMIVNTLASIYQAVDIGKENNHFIPHKLFSGALKRFIDNVYIQNNLFDSNAEAVEFFKLTMPVLEQYLEDIEKDITEVITWARQQLESDKSRDVDPYT